MPSNASALVKLALTLCLGTAGLSAAAVELKGFRGISWGEESDALGPAKLAQVDGDVRCYHRVRENMLFGDATLSEVRYCFNRNQLFMVTLEAAATPESLVAELRGTYGVPTLRSAGFVQWGGKTAQTRVELLAAPKSGRTTMHIYSTAHEPQ